MASEIFPANVRDVAIVFANALAWVGNIIVTLAFPNLIAGIGEANTFFLLSGICVASLAFANFMIPETKGTSLHDHRKSLLARDPDDAVLTPAGVTWN